MKKIILSLSAVLAFGFANAQDNAMNATKDVSAMGFSKGNIFLEGQLSFNSSTKTNSFAGVDNTEVKSSSLSFMPKVGYFVSDVFAVGVEASITSGKTENNDLLTPAESIDSKDSGFGAGVFARYYFLNLGERFKTYTELGVGFNSSKSEVKSVETDNSKSFNVGLDLGMNYFITPKMAISFTLANVLALNSQTDTDVTDPAGDAEVKTNNFSGNFNVFQNFFDTPTFGLLYKF